MKPETCRYFGGSLIKTFGQTHLKKNWHIPHEKNHIQLDSGKEEQARKCIYTWRQTSCKAPQPSPEQMQL